MKPNWILTLAIALIVGAGAFFGGVMYQKSQATSLAGNFGLRGQFAQRMGGRGGAFGGAIRGKIVSKDANSITVQLSDGSSKIINISGSTKIVKSSTASVADITTGTTVAVFGAANSDGSVNAQNIQIDPQMRGQASPTQGQ